MALGVATVLAVIVTFVLYRALRRNSGASSSVTQVVVAAHDLPAGVVLTHEDVLVANWPARATLPGSFSKVEDVINRPLIYPIGEKDPILERNLALEGSGLGLSVKIPPGMRATSVRSNEVVGVAGFLYPGSRVDVLATFAPPGGGNPVTQTILQNVEVLTAGEKVEPDPQGRPETVNVVTLLVDAEGSQKLLLASTEGTIQFVLRNSADNKTAPVSPTSLSQLLPGTVPAPRPAAAPAKRAATNSDGDGLEVIRGNTRTVEKF